MSEATPRQSPVITAQGEVRGTFWFQELLLKAIRLELGRSIKT